MWLGLTVTVPVSGLTSQETETWCSLKQFLIHKIRYNKLHTRFVLSTAVTAT